MDVRVTDTTIHIDGDADRATFPTEVDAIMREIGEQIGRKVGAVKLSGYWIIGDMSVPSGWDPLYGHLQGTGTRKFTKALAGAFNRAVVTKVQITTKGK